MERIFVATEDGYYFLPKEATTGNPLLNKRIEAMVPTVKSDAAGSHHQEMAGNPLFEHRVGNDDSDSTCERCGAKMNTIERLCPDCSEEESHKEARQPMHDDSGAATGLRRRPDYGESDSLTSKLNDGNSKGASAQYMIALAAHSRKEASKKATVYVTDIKWASDDCLKVAKFTFGSNPVKALKLGNITAKNVSQQLNGPKFGGKSHILITI